MVQVMYSKEMNMSIKKQWLITLILIATIAIITNSALYSILIDKYFVRYIGQNYEKQMKEIQEYAEFILHNELITKKQMQMEMQKYLDDPITEISIYDSTGQIILSAKKMGMGRMHRQMMGRENSEVRDEYNLEDGQNSIGKLIITRQGSIEDSVTSILFKKELLNTSLISGGIVLLMALVVSILISRKTAKDLMNTANYAKGLDLNLEEELPLSHITEITEIQNSLVLLATKLRMKEKARKQKLDTVVHQGRTPLTIMKSQLEGAVDGIVTMDENRLESLINQVDTLTDVIGNLKEIFEIEQAKDPLKIETFDLTEEINKIIKGFKLQFEDKGVRLAFLGEKGIVGTTDRYLLTQGIYNILTNAYKFTPKGGKVQLDIKKVGDRIELKIMDTGIGIPKDNLLTVFNPYVRGSNVGKITGQGLGLFVVKNNIERVGGRVDVSSVEGKGTTFVVNIPSTIQDE